MKNGGRSSGDVGSKRAPVEISLVAGRLAALCPARIDPIYLELQYNVNSGFLPTHQVRFDARCGIKQPQPKHTRTTHHLRALETNL